MWKSFSNSSNLNFHMRIHTEEEHLKCPECNKKLNFLNDLESYIGAYPGEKNILYAPNVTSHFQTFLISLLIWDHTEERNLLSASNVIRLFQTVHLNSNMKTCSDKKIINCIECDKSFSNGSNLISHMRIHNGEKHFKCP